MLGNRLIDNVSVVMRTTHNFRVDGDEIATDREINNRIINTYPTMCYMFDDDELSHTVIQNCADELHDQFIALYRTTLYVYNPIENYSMVESTDRNAANTSDSNSNTTNNATNCRCGKNTTTSNNATQSDNSTNATGQSNADNTRNEYGYNDKSPTTVQSDNNNSNTSTTTKSNDVSRSNTKNVNDEHVHECSDNAETNNTNSNSTDIEHITVKRSGNIGVTTSQQMIQQERDLIIDVIDWYVAHFVKCFMWGVI